MLGTDPLFDERIVISRDPWVSAWGSGIGLFLIATRHIVAALSGCWRETGRIMARDDLNQPPALLTDHS
jgi:hypothetical protein